MLAKKSIEPSLNDFQQFWPLQGRGLYFVRILIFSTKHESNSENSRCRNYKSNTYDDDFPFFYEQIKLIRFEIRFCR